MRVLDTEPYREAMAAYFPAHGLPPFTQVENEKGFIIHSHAPLGIEGRNVARRCQTNMVALRKDGKRVYPKVKISGELDAPFRAALIPPRPVFAVVFREICAHDVAARSHSTYTEGGSRWQAVNRFDGWLGMDAAIPQLRDGDCSSTYTGQILGALQMSMGRRPLVDVVNGLHWAAGNTDSIGRTMARVEEPQVGDAALYDGHVAGIYAAGRVPTVCNMGRPGEPVFKPYNERSGFIGFFRIRSTT